MPALERELADALVDELNGHTFALPITAERRHMPIFQPADIDDLQVSVIARRLNCANAARHVGGREIELSVAVQKRLDAPSDATDERDELDQLQDLSAEIRDYLEQRALTAAGAQFLRIEQAPLVDPAFLWEEHTYTTLITATYQGYEDHAA